MKKIIFKFFIFIILINLFNLSTASSEQNKQQIMTLGEVLQRALSENPNLKTAESQEKEAFFAFKSAGAMPNLILTGNYTAGNNTIPSNNGDQPDANVNLSQSFGPLGSTALSGKAAFQSYEIARANTEETKILLIQNTKDAFYTLLSAQEQLCISNENLKLADELYELAKKKFNAGAVPEIDMVNAKIQKAASEQAVIQAKAALKQAQSALNAILAYSPENSLQVSGSLGLTELKIDSETLIKMAAEKRPAVSAAKKGVEQAQTQVKLARSQRNPAPGLFYSYDLTTTPLYLIGASLQVPVFDYGQINNQIKVQQTTVKEKENNLRGTILAVSSSVKSAYAAYEGAYKNAVTFKEEVLLPSEKLMKMALFGYTQGAVSYLQVLTAEQNLKSTRVQYITLLLSGHQAFDALEASVGKTLEGEMP
ncbi:MAG: TolC family protein [Firmicutes bacterium]|nr:TolC family protein [Bacillota bacterium]